MCETFVFLYESGDEKNEAEIVNAYHATAEAVALTNKHFNARFVGVAKKPSSSKCHEGEVAMNALAVMTRREKIKD